MEVVLPAFRCRGQRHEITIFHGQISLRLCDALYGFALKKIGGGGIEPCFGEAKVHAVVVVCRFFAGAEGVAYQDVAYFLLYTLQSIEATAEERYPTAGASAVFVRVAEEQVEHTFIVFVSGKLPALNHLILRNAVNGEHVDIHTTEVAEVEPFDKRGIGILYLSERQGIGGVSLGTDKLVGCGQPFGSMGCEEVVVGARHGNVYVVVPRDESAVAYGSEHGTCPYRVVQVVLFAHRVDGKQYLQDACMEGADVVSCHISVEVWGNELAGVVEVFHRVKFYGEVPCGVYHPKGMAFGYQSLEGFFIEDVFEMLLGHHFV